jgi:DNA-directed RNA polymerase subunit K/omega
MDKKDHFDEDDDEVLIEYDIQEKEEEVEKRTNPILSLYEFSNLMTKRIEQLEDGYKSNLSKEEIKEKNLVLSHEIAKEEFKEKKFPPFKIKRMLPNGRYELWDLEDMKFLPEN